MRFLRATGILVLAVRAGGGPCVLHPAALRRESAAAAADRAMATAPARRAAASTLTDAKVAAAGIELDKAGPGVLHESLFLNGILQPNQESLVQVTPRFPGVAREIHKRIGDRVQKGDLLAKVESNQSLTVYELRAPLAGTIIERQIALGEHVGEQKAAFTIADLSSVWVDFAVYRRDLQEGDASAPPC